MTQLFPGRSYILEGNRQAVKMSQGREEVWRPGAGEATIKVKEAS